MPSTYYQQSQENILKKQQQAAARQAAAQQNAQAQSIAYQNAAAPAVQTTNAGSASSGGYTPSAAVLSAQQYLQEQIANKPGAYASKYNDQLESILSQIQNREAFKYDAAADPLYNIYKDLYIQNGRRAMQDTIGNAAALTGGYGSSYAQSAGQQMYNQYMEALNARVPELQQQAYQRYSDEGDRMAQSWQMYNTLENQHFNQYQTALSAWQNERSLAQQAAIQAEQFDRQQYQYDTTLAENQRQFDITEAFRRDQLAEQARQFDANLAEQIRQADMTDARERDKLAEQARQYDASLAEEIRQYDTDAAYRQAQADLAAEQWTKEYEQSVLNANRNYELNALNADRDYELNNAQLAEKQREFDIAQALEQAQFDLTVRKYEDALAQAAAGSDGSGGNGGTSKESEEEKKSTSDTQLVTLPVLQTNLLGNANAGPLAQSTPAMTQTQAETLLDQMANIYQNSAQGNNANKALAQQKAANANIEDAALSALLQSDIGYAALQAAKNQTAKKAAKSNQQAVDDILKLFK